MNQVVAQLVAHRGIRARYPENSLVGLEAAMRAHARYIEFDIQCTADNRLILLHDTTLDRISGAGGDEIFEYRFEQLHDLDTGEAERFGDLFSGTRIPLLSQLVELAQTYPDSVLLAEIKPQSLLRFGVKAVMDQLFFELLPILNRCFIISFHLPALTYMREQKVGYRCGWVLDAYSNKQRRQAQRLNPELLIGSRKFLTPATQLWPGHWQWMVYEVNSPEEAVEYAAAGIELVETADIVSMQQHPLLRQYTP